MLNWIVWNRTVLYSVCILMLNWIVENRAAYMYKNEFNIECPMMVDMP